MVDDPIADFIIQLKNASITGRKSVVVQHSKVLYAISELLITAGYLKKVVKKGKKIKKVLEVELYDNGTRRISKATRISKLSRRLYKSADALQAYGRNRGVVVVSTPSGIMTSTEAVKQNVGGEVLFSIS
jgi:small subunit ribosomal protein S8